MCRPVCCQLAWGGDQSESACAKSPGRCAGVRAPARRFCTPYGASLRRARNAGAAGIRHIIRIEPGSADPAVLVIFGEALLGERNHTVERARAARTPHRLDANVLVVAGVVPLIELMTPAELGADRIPQELHHLDALLVVDAVRAAHIARQIGIDRR